MRENSIETISETMGFLSARKSRAGHLAKHVTHSSIMRGIFTCQAKIIPNAIVFPFNIKWNLQFKFMHGFPISGRSPMIFLKKPINSQSMHITWGKPMFLVFFIFSIINVLYVLATNLLQSISSINSM